MTTEPEFTPQPAEFDKLKRGDGIVMRFGSRGYQYGIVYGRSSVNGYLQVVKWRMVSKSWTGRVRLGRGDFICRATSGGGPDERLRKGVTTIPMDIWSGAR